MSDEMPDEMAVGTWHCDVCGMRVGSISAPAAITLIVICACGSIVEILPEKAAS